MSDDQIEKFRRKLFSIIEKAMIKLGEEVKEIDRQHGSFWSMFSSGPEKRFPLFIEAYKESFDRVAARVLKARKAALDKGILSQEDIDQQVIGLLWSYSEPPDAFMHRLYLLVEDDPRRRRKAIAKLMDDLQERLNEVLRPMGFEVTSGAGGDQYVVNNIISQSTVHGSVQQGTTDSEINVTTHLNVAEVVNSVGAAEQEIIRLDASPEKYALLAEIERMKKNLQEAKPSKSLLGKCAARIGTIMEDVAVGVVTPGATSAIGRLLTLF